jgi:hypothetical protein
MVGVQKSELNVTLVFQLESRRGVQGNGLDDVPQVSVSDRAGLDYALGEIGAAPVSLQTNEDLASGRRAVYEGRPEAYQAPQMVAVNMAQEASQWLGTTGLLNEAINLKILVFEVFEFVCTGVH